MTDKYIYISDDAKQKLVSYILKILTTPIKDMDTLVRSSNKVFVSISIFNPSIHKILAETLFFITSDVRNIIYSYIDVHANIIVKLKRTTYSSVLKTLSFHLYEENVLHYTFSYSLYKCNYILHMVDSKDNDDVIKYTFKDSSKYNSLIFQDVHKYFYYDDEISFFNYMMRNNKYINVHSRKIKFTRYDNIVKSDTCIVYENMAVRTHTLTREIINEEQLKHNIMCIKTIIDIIHHTVMQYILNDESELDELL